MRAPKHLSPRLTWLVVVMAAVMWTYGLLLVLGWLERLE